MGTPSPSRAVILTDKRRLMFKANLASRGQMHDLLSFHAEAQSPSLTWQSSTLVFMTPFMYSFSMVGDTPKLLPMHRTSVRLSGYVTSTDPFRITDHESSWRHETWIKHRPAHADNTALPKGDAAFTRAACERAI